MLAEAVEAAEPSPERILCPYCGAENEADLLYCVECGQALTPEKAAEEIGREPLPEVLVASRRGLFSAKAFKDPGAKRKALSWGFIGLVLIVVGYFAISSLVVDLTRGEARQLADSVVYSLHPEFQGVVPYVQHTREGSQYFSTYSYSMNIVGKLAGGGGQVEFTQVMVIEVNRSQGNFEVLSAY